MSEYIRVSRVYLTKTTIQVWCFLLVSLLAITLTNLEDLAQSQGGFLSGLLSRKSYLAMFSYFNGCVLGALLRSNLAHPWASIVPNYRRTHLIVVSAIAILLVGIPMLSMEVIAESGIALASVAVIFVAGLAAGLWTLHHPLLGLLAIPFLLFTFAPSESSPALTAFTLGTAPVASACVAGVSLLAIAALAWRVCVMNEEMNEYRTARVWTGFVRGGQSLEFPNVYSSLASDHHTARSTRHDALPAWLTIQRPIDRVANSRPRNIWQRAQLWRLGTASTRLPVSLALLVVVTLLMIPPMTMIQRLADTENPARDAVLIFSIQVMTNPVLLWLPWLSRRHRLGVESLRPTSRQGFVRELGLALCFDTFQCWIAGILTMGVAAFLWAPDLLRARELVIVVLCTGAGQICAYAWMATRLSTISKDGNVAGATWSFVPLLVMATWMLFAVQRVPFAVSLLLAFILATAGLAAIAFAYRKACQSDLG